MEAEEELVCFECVRALVRVCLREAVRMCACVVHVRVGGPRRRRAADPATSDLSGATDG